jgi:hypothetical protein
MADVIFLSVVVGFFVLAALFVRACAAVVGPDEQAAPGRAEPDASRVAA